MVQCAGSQPCFVYFNFVTSLRPAVRLVVPIMNQLSAGRVLGFAVLLCIASIQGSMANDCYSVTVCVGQHTAVAE